MLTTQGRAIGCDLRSRVSLTAGEERPSPVNDVANLLAEIHGCGVQVDSILGWPERRDGAGGVGMIAGSQRRSLGFETFRLNGQAALTDAAAGAGLGRGGQKDLQIGVGENDRPYVPPVHYDVLPGPDQSSKPRIDPLPYHGNRGNG